MLNYQGRIVVGGVNFEGIGQFKFALINGADGTSLWSNDGTGGADAEPAAAVPLGVTKGLYGVLLGDTAKAGMTVPISPTVFAAPDVRLRVWFSGGGGAGFERLAPDQRIAPVGYAHVAATVPDGSITAAKFAPGAVEAAQLPENPEFAGTVTAVQFLGSGQGLTGLDAGQISTGTLSDARLSSNVVFRAEGSRIAVGSGIDVGSEPRFAEDAAITFWGERFLSGGFLDSVFLGIGAGVRQPEFIESYEANTGLGSRTLGSLQGGRGNTALGSGAISKFTSGSENTAVGADALGSAGNALVDNTAVGSGSLYNFSTGLRNTAVGARSLYGLSTGWSNVVIGFQAGYNLLRGSNNLYVANPGVPEESNIIRIGGDQHTDMYLAGTVHANLAPGVVSVANIAVDSTGLARVSGNTLTATDVSVDASVPLSAPAFVGSGSGLTDLDAGNLVTGTIPDARLSPNVVIRDDDGTLTAGSRRLLTFETAGNVFVGPSAGKVPNNNAIENTAMGDGALSAIINGGFNVAFGYNALARNFEGGMNTAVGANALFQDTGIQNTALGGNALVNKVSGRNNTAAGFSTLENLTEGDSNTALGYRAGLNLTVGTNNLYLGSVGRPGPAGARDESNTIRIGDEGRHVETHVAGVFGVTASGGAPVYVTSDGQLGTLDSSRRFKDDIRDMGEASSVLDALRPVRFKYRSERDPSGRSQFGLIAEEVNEVAPELVVHDRDGGVQSVRYEAVNAMLLNEFQKERRRAAEQENTIRGLKQDLARLNSQLEALTTLVRRQLQSGVTSPPPADPVGVVPSTTREGVQ